MNLRKTLTPVNPIALADILFRKDKRIQLFLDLPLDKRIDMLGKVTLAVKKDILNHMPNHDLAGIVQVLDPNDATDILQLMSKNKREKVLLMLSEEVKGSLSTLLEFDPKTAAGLMALDYIQVNESDDIATVAQHFKRHEKRTGRLPVILVIKEGKLIGFVPGHELGLASKHERIGKYIKRVPTISYAATHQQVIDKFYAHPHGKVVVLNDAGHVMGIIYSDDVLRLIEDQAGASLYDFAGVSDEESVTDSTRKKSRPATNG